jgi:predicted secreted hydrolase
MRNNWYKKSLVAGIIILLIGVTFASGITFKVETSKIVQPELAKSELVEIPVQIYRADGQTNALPKTLGDSRMLISNILDPEDEGDHFPCGCEWWWVGAVLTQENGKEWNVALSFVYFMNRTRWGYYPCLSFYRVQCVDIESGKFYDFRHEDKFPNTLFNFSKNMVDINYNNCTMKGLFPDYVIHAEDTKNNISFNLRYHSESNPYWLMNESTGGIIPWGFSGTFKYYFILRNYVTGNLSINGSCYNVTGVGYYEHQFGDITLQIPLKIYSIKEFRDIKTLYSKFFRWYRTEITTNKRRPLQSIHLGTDSFGWDVIWATFDNGYSIVLSRMRLFGLINGRSFVGPLLALTYGKNSWEFGDVYLDVKKTLYIEESNNYIPLDLEITAYKGNKTLYIVFNSTLRKAQSYENREGNFYVPCIANGYLIDGGKNISLKGIGGNNPGYFFTKQKYRSLDIDLLLPPHGLGISIKSVSHKSGIERFFKLQLRPTFEFIYYIKTIPDV